MSWRSFILNRAPTVWVLLLDSFWLSVQGTRHSVMGGGRAFRPVLPATVMCRTLHPVSPRPPIRKLAGTGDSWKQRVQSLRAPTCSAPRKVLFSAHTSNSGQTATELTTLTDHTALAWLLEDMTISFPDRHPSHLSGDTPGKRLLSSPAQYLESHVL